MFAFELGSGSIVLRVQLSATERLGPAIVGDEGPLPGPRRVDQASRREYSLVGLDPQALFPRPHHSRVSRAVDGKFELLFRSEERRVGKECVSTCSSRVSPSLSKNKKLNI